MVDQSKRQAPANDDAKRKKRAKLIKARTILAENADKSLFDGRLDVNSFIKSREFEVQQLENAMSNSKNSNRVRVFQSLPRSLRRRAASHNVKRVPKRIRKKAEYEMQNESESTKMTLKEKQKKKKKRKEDAKLLSDIQKNAKSAADLGVNDSAMDIDDGEDISVVENTNSQSSRGLTGINSLASPPQGKIKYKSRQKSKVWLPTHVWHAKRAHLESLWGYSIPITPTQKCYRATHRAASFAGLRAGTLAWDKSYFGTLILESKELKDLINLCELLTAGSSDITKPCYTKGYRCWEGMLYDSNGLIGPGLIYFKHKDAQDDSSPYSILIRIHPSIFNSVYESIVLLIASKFNNITYYDCRYSIGSIEVLGPQSTNSLISILRCVDHNSEVSKTWRSLAGLSNPSSLPTNIAITMNIHDPRLFFPPHKPQRTKVSKNSDDPFSKLITEWPYKEMVKTSSIFSIDERENSYANQLTLKKLNKRRTDMNDPGKHLKPESNDPHIPIALLRTQSKDGWTLLAPWGWILPIWFSLFHFPEIQLSGLTQEHQIAFEQGKPYFPDDYPGTEVGHSINWNKSKESYAKWNSKPPAKRVSFDKVATGSSVPGEHGDPFLCDWNYLSKVYTKIPLDISQSVIVTSTQPSQHTHTTNETSDSTSLSTVIAKRSEVPPPKVIVQSMSKNGATQSHLSVSTVNVKYLQRGSPIDRARIYRIPDIKFWKEVLDQKRLNKDDKKRIDMKEYPLCPSSDYLIGYITSGDYNLAEGCGSGVGSIITNYTLESKDQLCLVRNVGSSIVRLARWSYV